jgi:hypothetical protein
MYTPNNLYIYLGALEGAIAGMAASEKVITNSDPLTYSSQAAMASAFAQAVDSQLPPQSNPLPATANVLVSQLAYGVWQDRTPTPTAANLLPATYLPIAQALIALGTAVFNQLTVDSINVNAASSVQPYAPTFTNLDSTATIGDGSITGVYKQDGDTLSFAIQVVAGTTTDYGTGSPLLVPLPPGYAIDPSKLNPAVFISALGVSAQGWQSNIAGIISGGPALFPFLMFRAETAPAVFQDITVIPVTGLATPGDAFLFSVTGLPIMLV